MSQCGEIWSLQWLCTAAPAISEDITVTFSSCSLSYLLTTDRRSDWVMLDLKVSRLSAWTQLFLRDIGADLAERRIFSAVGWLFVLTFNFKHFPGENISACLDHDGEGDLSRLTVCNVTVLELVMLRVGCCLPLPSGQLWCHFEYNTQTVISLTHTSHNTAYTTWHSAWEGFTLVPSSNLHNASVL